ncbi:MAG: phage minor head protein [Thermoanaerobaculia bacterium]
MPNQYTVPTFQSVLDIWSKRKILPSDIFAALSDERRGQAGRLADVWNTHFVTDIYGSLLEAIRDGQTTREWLPKAQQILDAYGAAEGTTVYTGERFSAWYGDLVFRTNTANAYAAGRYAEMFSPEWIQASPFWLYSAIHDKRTRTTHWQLDGKVFRKDDAAARRFLPPWGFNCRCNAIELDAADFRDGRYRLSHGSEVEIQPPEGWDADRVASLVPEILRARGGA